VTGDPAHYLPSTEPIDREPRGYQLLNTENEVLPRETLASAGVELASTTT
jgi:hypothetical protein